MSSALHTNTEGRRQALSLSLPLSFFFYTLNLLHHQPLFTLSSPPLLYLLPRQLFFRVVLQTRRRSPMLSEKKRPTSKLQENKEVGRLLFTAEAAIIIWCVGARSCVCVSVCEGGYCNHTALPRAPSASINKPIVEKYPRGRGGRASEGI